MGGQYSLIHYTTFKPLPDYWASVLHKRLMGTAVLDVRDSLQMGRSIRTWASCAHENAGAPHGAVTLLILNTKSTVATVRPVANGTQPGLDLLSGGWDECVIHSCLLRNQSESAKQYSRLCSMNSPVLCFELVLIDRVLTVVTTCFDTSGTCSHLPTALLGFLRKMSRSMAVN